MIITGQVYGSSGESRLVLIKIDKIHESAALVSRSLQNFSALGYKIFWVVYSHCLYQAVAEVED